MIPIVETHLDKSWLWHAVHTHHEDDCGSRITGGGTWTVSTTGPLAGPEPTASTSAATQVLHHSTHLILTDLSTLDLRTKFLKLSHNAALITLTISRRAITLSACSFSTFRLRPAIPTSPTAAAKTLPTSAATTSSPHELRQIHLIYVETQGHRCRTYIRGLHDCIIWNQYHIQCLVYQDLDLGIHTRFQELQTIVQTHDHREHRDILNNRSLRLYLVNHTQERLIRVGFDGHNGLQAGG